MFTVSPGMRLCPVGTSLTAGGPVVTQPRGWWQDVVGMGGRVSRGNGVTGSSGLVGTTGGGIASFSSNPPVAVHYPSLAEIGGAKMSDLLAIWASTLVGPFEPSIDGFLLEGNINDIFHDTDQTTFGNQVAQMLALTGTRPVLWMGALLGYVGTGENDTLFGDAFNLKIETYNAIVASKCAAAGSRVTYMDLRPTFKAWEIANNPSHLGGGLITSDGVHLSEHGLGIVKIASRAYVSLG